jgi:hypothetical protein
MKEGKIIELLNNELNNSDNNLEIGDLNAEEKNLFKSITSMDAILSKHNIESTSPAFTDKLMHHVMSGKLQTSGSKILKMLALAVGLILLSTIIVFTFWSGSFEAPSKINLVVGQFYNLMKIFSEPKFKQLFLIFEGIVLLIIIEKVISGYRFFHKRSPEGA